jgi:lysophospholipase L1-like esterase
MWEITLFPVSSGSSTFGQLPRRMISPRRFSSVIARARLASSIVAIGVLGLANSLPAQIRVVNSGDSITAGAGSSTPQRAYSAVLAGLLGSGYAVQAQGTGGSTALSDGQPSFVDTPTYTASIAANPNIVTILLGTNDSKAENRARLDEFVGDYVSLIDSYRALSTAPRVYLALPPPAIELGTSDISGAAVANEVIPLIFEVARQRNLRVIDLNTPLSEPFQAYSADGVHPNDEGHRVIAERMRDAIVGGRSLRGLPQPWERGTVGVGLNGADALDQDNRLIVLGAGVSVGGAADAFRFVAQPVSGDMEVTARYVGQRNMNPLSTTLPESSAGVMLRVGTGAGARHVSVLATPQNGVSLRWRTADGANTGIVTVANVSPPVWLRVRRVGNVFTGFYSANGSNWSALGQPITLALPDTLLAGFAANSGSSDQLSRAGFEQINLAGSGAQNPPPVVDDEPPPVEADEGRAREGRGLSVSRNPGIFRADWEERPRGLFRRDR